MNMYFQIWFSRWMKKSKLTFNTKFVIRRTIQMTWKNAKKQNMKSNYTRLSLRNIFNVDDRFTNTKPIGILLSTYFLLFFYDLIQFATKTDTTMLLFTHTNSVEISNQNGQIERRLLLIYVFHHWSRPLAACVRNLLCLTTTSQTKCQKFILYR